MVDLLRALRRRDVAHLFRESLVKNASWMLSSSMANAVMGAAAWAMISRMFPSEAIGRSSAAISAFGIVASMAELGLGITLIRFLSTSPYPAEFANAILTASIGASAALGILFLCAIRIIAPELAFITSDPRFIAIALLGICAIAASSLCGSLFMTLRKTKFIMAQDTTASVLRLACVVPAGLLMGSALGIVTICVLPTLLMAVVALVWFMPRALPGYRLRLSTKTEHIRPHLRYSLGNFIARVMLEAHVLLIPPIALHQLGAKTAGRFYLCWLLSQMVRFIPAAASNSLFAEASNRPSELHSQTKRALVFTGLLLIPAILVIGIGDGLIMRILFGVVIDDAESWSLRTLLLANVPWTINYLVVSLCRCRSDLFWLCTLSATLLLGIAFIVPVAGATYGMAGIGTGFLLGQCLACIPALLYLRKLWRIPMVPT